MHKKQLLACCDPLRHLCGLQETCACAQVREPRAVLKEFGTVLPEDTVIRVHDSTADLRWAPLQGAHKCTPDYLALVGHALAAWIPWPLTMEVRLGDDAHALLQQRHPLEVLESAAQR